MKIANAQHYSRGFFASTFASTHCLVEFATNRLGLFVKRLGSINFRHFRLHKEIYRYSLQISAVDTKLLYVWKTTLEFIILQRIFSSSSIELKKIPIYFNFELIAKLDYRRIFLWLDFTSWWILIRSSPGRKLPGESQLEENFDSSCHGGFRRGLFPRAW